MLWTAQTDGWSVTATKKELTSFKELWVRSGPSHRMSDLFVFDMYVLLNAYGVAPCEILESINALETGEREFGVKPATQFKHPPLRGLWHKHYFTASFLSKNILTGLGRNGLEKIVRESLDSSEPRITEEMIRILAHRIVNEPIEERYANGRLTGEWIVYVKHSGQNYYLTLSTHDTEDQFLYDKIIEHCTRNFPELRLWIDASL